MPIKPSLLLAVCNAVGASEKDASNVVEGHWVSARIPMTKHWLHPYLVMRPSNGPVSGGFGGVGSLPMRARRPKKNDPLPVTKSGAPRFGRIRPRNPIILNYIRWLATRAEGEGNRPRCRGRDSGGRTARAAPARARDGAEAVSVGASSKAGSSPEAGRLRNENRLCRFHSK